MNHLDARPRQKHALANPNPLDEHCLGGHMKIPGCGALAALKCQRFYLCEARQPPTKSSAEFQLFNLSLVCHWKLLVQIEVEFQEVDPGLA